MRARHRRIQKQREEWVAMFMRVDFAAAAAAFAEFGIALRTGFAEIARIGRMGGRS